MKLPKPEEALIDERKVQDYLLSSTHPVGRFKARVFASVGFDDSRVTEFTAEIRRIAVTNEVFDVQDTGFGRKYTVLGFLNGPTGTLQVLTVWIQESARETVRLVTVRPRRS